MAGSDPPSIPVVALGEYRYGLERSRIRPQIEALLELLLSDTPIVSIDSATAQHYAEVRDHLRGKGTPIPENDVWIAALARQHGLPIVSQDRHFDRVAGVDRFGW